MSYTRVWNSSTPLINVTAANTLGVVIRNFKGDVEERLNDILGIANWAADPIVPTSLKLNRTTVAKILGGTTSLSLRNSLDTLDNLIITDAGVATFRAAVNAPSFVGALTGNVTGNVTGSSGSTTGNAATATALQTARTIWGQSFDGSAAISGALSGATSGAFSGAVSMAGLTATTIAASGNAVITKSGAGNSMHFGATNSTGAKSAYFGMDTSTGANFFGTGAYPAIVYSDTILQLGGMGALGLTLGTGGAATFPGAVTLSSTLAVLTDGLIVDSTKRVLIGTTVTAGASAGDVVLANAKALRGAGASSTYPLVNLNASEQVELGGANTNIKILSASFTGGLITVGAVDSGGAGYRVLRIPN